jgi:hypothetical protein
MNSDHLKGAERKHKRRLGVGDYESREKTRGKDEGQGKKILDIGKKNEQNRVKRYKAR